MELIGPILSSLIMIFILIIPGVFFRKRNLITENQNDAVSGIVVNLTWPCLVIDAMQMRFSARILQNSLHILALTIVVFAVLALLGLVLAKLIKMPKTKQYLTVFMMIFGNTGFIGIPVIKALYGTEALFFAAIIELINDILLFTVGIMLIQLSAGARCRVDLRQFLNPGLIGVLIGLALFLLDIQLPQVLGGSIEMIGNATTPLTMFVIGVQLGGLKLKEIIGDWQVYAVCAARLLLVPVAALLVVKLWMWGGDFSLLEKVIIVSFAMPAASVSAIFSQQYKGEAVFATKTVLLSTVFSLLTIPIFAVIMEL